ADVRVRGRGARDDRDRACPPRARARNAAAFHRNSAVDSRVSTVRTSGIGKRESGIGTPSEPIDSHLPSVAGRPPIPDSLHCRGDFPILATKVRGEVPLVYLDNAATTQKP